MSAISKTSLDSPGSSGPGTSFGSFRLETDGTLFRGEAVVHLPPKELAALRLLLAHAGQVVTPHQLKEELWGDVHVTADSIPKCISSLRARLEPDDCIQTVYKRGYRLSAQVRRDEASAQPLLRLAVMPFVCGQGVPEYLGQAVAEEALAGFTSMHPPVVLVLARDSVFALAERGLTAHRLGEALKADLVLTGTLRALPLHFRLRAEMIRVQDGAQIWVEDMLVEQSRIAGLEAELVDRLLFHLGTGMPVDRSAWPERHGGGLSISAAAAPETGDSTGSRQLEAYETFQRARHEWQTLERHRMQDGMQHLTRATELDPSLVAAKVDLVHLCVTQAFYGYMAPRVAADLVRRTAESIAELPRRADAILPSLGWVNFHVEYNLPGALWAFSRSAHLPHDTWTTRERAQFALSRHRFDEAIALLESALEVDPFAPWLHGRLAWALHLKGQARESVALIRRSLAHFPGQDGVLLYGAMILAFNGDAADGVKLAQELALRHPNIDLVAAVHAYALACANRKDEAQSILERLQWLSRERFVISSFNPAAYVVLGDHEAALAALRTAERDRCPWFFQMLADPRLKPLRSYAEFEGMRGILTRMEAAASEPEV